MCVGEEEGEAGCDDRAVPFPCAGGDRPARYAEP